MDPTTLRMMFGATAPPVSITFYADNYAPAGNAFVALYWSATNAQSVSINQGIGSVATSGTTSVQGNGETRTYTLSVVGLDGINYSASFTVVWAPALVCRTFWTHPGEFEWYCEFYPDIAQCLPRCS